MRLALARNMGTSGAMATELTEEQGQAEEVIVVGVMGNHFKLIAKERGAVSFMATAKQELGTFGEEQVVRDCSCPRCKRLRTLVRLPSNFKCADVICDFCGYLGQVKSVTTKDINKLPKTILGAA